jgi:hypothetical protein
MPSTLWRFQREDATASGALFVIAIVSALLLALLVIGVVACCRARKWNEMRRRRAVIAECTEPLFNAPSRYAGSAYK